MRGLVNLGNTCYFNTAVQCLAHVPPLTKHFFFNDLDDLQCEITREYQKVVMALFTKGAQGPVDPRNLLSAFRTRFPAFANNGQHDAQEVTLVLIDVFEQSLGKEFVTKIFNGEEAQETTWPDGTKIKRSPFTTLILDVGEPARLADLIRDREEPTGISDYIDDSGKKHHVAAIRNRVERWPNVIGFTFAMYSYKFPIEIPLEFEGRKLFACILHTGAQYGGHYALLVRRYDKWYIKDDENVNEIPNIETLKGEFYQAWYRPVNSLN
jgi:ubiquitin C-terminal hydrolase